MSMKDGKHPQPTPSVGDDDVWHETPLPQRMEKHVPPPAGISQNQDSDDIIHLDNLQKNAPVSGGEDDNIDVNVSMDSSSADHYQTKPMPGWPLY